MILCVMVYPVPVMLKVDVFSKRSVVFALIFTAVYMLIWSVLPALITYFGLKKKRSRKMRLLFAAGMFAISEAIVFLCYPTTMPQLYGIDSPNPVRELQNAFLILDDDSEPVTVICKCTVRRYLVTSDSKYRDVFPVRYALCLESGLEIPCNHVKEGDYTVTYSPVTKLPVSVIPLNNR